MTYAKTTWSDRIVQNPLTYTQQTNADGTITLIPAEGTITQAGTPITANALNNMENGIADALPKTGGGTIVGDVDIQGTLLAEGEAHFASSVGTYSDPRPNVRQALKVSGGFAANTVFIGDAKVSMGVDPNSGLVFVPDAGSGRYVFYCDNNQYFVMDDAYGASLFSSGMVRTVFHQTDATFRIEQIDGGAANLIVSKINGSSDKNIKKNIAEFKEDALENIKNTKIYDYHFIGEDESERKKTGILADEAPPCVRGDDGKSVDIYGMTSVAWKAIQELANKVDKLEKQLSNNSGGKK